MNGHFSRLKNKYMYILSSCKSTTFGPIPLCICPTASIPTNIEMSDGFLPKQKTSQYLKIQPFGIIYVWEGQKWKVTHFCMGWGQISKSGWGGLMVGG